MATFKTQIEDITSAVGDDAALNQWLTDGAKEIINILPLDLKEKCATYTQLSNSPTTMDLDSVGDILRVTRENANSGYQIACRQINPSLGGSSEDSSSLHYVTATDPVYWTTSNTSDAGTLFVKPTPTANQTADVYHVSYPDIGGGDSAVANFPDEAEYLVVLYASIKGLQRLMNDMNGTVTAIDTTALGAIATELGETQAVCDLVQADLVLAKAEVVLAKAEAAELAAQTDSSAQFAIATAAINSELDKVDEIITLAKDEFDEVATQVSGSKDSPITDAFTQFELVAAQLALGETDTEGDINTALTAMKASLDQAEAAANKFEVADADSIFGDESTFLTADSQLTYVKDALIKAQTLIDGATMGGDTEPQSAQYWLNDEDTEMVQATLQTAQTEIQRAQAEIQHWNAMGDMRVKEIQVALAEADGYAKEVQARLAQAQAKREEASARIAAGNAYLGEAKVLIEAGDAYIKESQARIAQAQGYVAEVGARATFSEAKFKSIQGYINTAQSYVATAQGFGGEIQAKVNIAQGYVAEAKIRMERESQKYGWYQTQQLKLQQDYDKGIQMLVAGGIPKPVREERRR